MTGLLLPLAGLLAAALLWSAGAGWMVSVEPVVAVVLVEVQLQQEVVQ